MDDWTASATAAAVPPTRAPDCPQPVTLTRPAPSWMSSAETPQDGGSCRALQKSPSWGMPPASPDGSDRVVRFPRMILIVAATERELAGAEGAATLACGMGPVDAAAATAHALTVRRPEAVLHIGIAGARGIPAAELVIGSEAVYEDAGDGPLVAARALPDPRLLEAARRALPEARVLPIGTSGRVGGTSGCDVEAMEGFAVLRAAELRVRDADVACAEGHGDTPLRGRLSGPGGLLLRDRRATEARGRVEPPGRTGNLVRGATPARCRPSHEVGGVHPRRAHGKTAPRWARSVPVQHVDAARPGARSHVRHAARVARLSSAGCAQRSGALRRSVQGLHVEPALRPESFEPWPFAGARPAGALGARRAEQHGARFRRQRAPAGCAAAGGGHQAFETAFRRRGGMRARLRTHRLAPAQLGWTLCVCRRCG